jgi:hypothetical protein
VFLFLGMHVSFWHWVSVAFFSSVAGFRPCLPYTFFRMGSGEQSVCCERNIAHPN